jgi:hypothetical protein
MHRKGICKSYYRTARLGQRGNGLAECIVCGSVLKKNQKKCHNCGASQDEDDDY